MAEARKKSLTLPFCIELIFNLFSIMLHLFLSISVSPRSFNSITFPSCILAPHIFIRKMPLKMTAILFIKRICRGKRSAWKTIKRHIQMRSSCMLSFLFFFCAIEIEYNYTRFSAKQILAFFGSNCFIFGTLISHRVYRHEKYLFKDSSNIYGKVNGGS